MEPGWNKYLGQQTEEDKVGKGPAYLRHTSLLTSPLFKYMNGPSMGLNKMAAKKGNKQGKDKCYPELEDPRQLYHLSTTQTSNREKGMNAF